MTQGASICLITGSERDSLYGRNFDETQLEKHAAYYGKLFEVFKEINAEDDKPLKAVTIWGLTDYPNEPKGTYTYNLNSPYGGLFDANLQPKAAYDRVVEALFGQSSP